MRLNEIPVPLVLNDTSIHDFISTLELAARDPAVDVLVLKGSTEGFCRGLDLEMLAASPTSRARGLNEYVRALRRLRFLSKATIALVEGPALGGGVGIVAACDVVLATKTASLGLPEVLFGLVPATIFPLLLERMTPQQARLLALQGLSRDADYCARIGLVDEVVDASELRAACRSAARLLRRGAPRAVGELKRLSAEMAELELGTALAHGAAFTTTVLSDKQRLAALETFRDEGTITWTDP